MLSWIEWTVFRKAHTCAYKVLQFTLQNYKNQAMKSKELSLQI